MVQKGKKFNYDNIKEINGKSVVTLISTATLGLSDKISEPIFTEKIVYFMTSDGIIGNDNKFHKDFDNLLLIEDEQLLSDARGIIFKVVNWYIPELAYDKILLAKENRKVDLLKFETKVINNKNKVVKIDILTKAEELIKDTYYLENQLELNKKNPTSLIFNILSSCYPLNYNFKAIPERIETLKQLTSSYFRINSMGIVSINIYNDKVVKVIFKDGDNVINKLSDNETFDLEKAVLLALVKYRYKDSYTYNMFDALSDINDINKNANTK